MKKYCVSFYTADEKLCEYENFLVKCLKTGTNLFNLGHPDSISKTETVGMFSPRKYMWTKCFYV